MRVCDWGRQYGYRHFFYGSTDNVVKRLIERLTLQFPGLIVSGFFCPPFRQLTAKEDWLAVSTINDARPDVVWVGLGGYKTNSLDGPALWQNASCCPDRGRRSIQLAFRTRKACPCMDAQMWDGVGIQDGNRAEEDRAAYKAYAAILSTSWPGGPLLPHVPRR